MKQHPEWPAAEALLALVLPGSTGFDPDEIAGLSVDGWEPFDIEERDPDAVEADLAARCLAVLAGDLIVVTDTSYRDDVGPHTVPAGELGGFLAGFAERFGEVPVGGDVVVLGPAAGAAVVVHHNGLIATVRGRSAAPPRGQR